MNGLKVSPKLLYLPSNSLGNDYIVGDLHGMFDELLVLLDHIGFNSNDRLFSVGDLVDRGPKSIELLREFRIRDNWYFVKGNHEDMMINSIVFKSPNDYDLWLSNGGNWIFSENDDELTEIAIWMSENIPTIMVVGENENRFNVCHAELLNFKSIFGVSNKDVDTWNFTSTEEEEIIWGRNIYKDYESDYFINDNPFRYHSSELSTTYVGHTPHFLDKEDMKVLRLEKHVYMDTGACFMKHNRYKDDALLSIINHKTGVSYFLNNEGQIFEGV
jgi:serine/threonine protein phosphatase 1